MMEKLNDFCCVQTKVDTLPSEDKLLATIRSYRFVVQYTLDGVEVLEAAHYGSLPKDLLELRAFDDVGELHMVMMGGKLRGRIRKDGEGTPCDVFDEEHLLWGERVSRNEGSYVLREDRGTRIAVPEAAFEGLCEPGGSSQDKQNRVTVRVRNYLDKQDESPLTGDHRFAFCDYRLVCFNVREVEKRGEV